MKECIERLTWRDRVEWTHSLRWKSRSGGRDSDDGYIPTTVAFARPGSDRSRSPSSSLGRGNIGSSSSSSPSSPATGAASLLTTACRSAPASLLIRPSGPSGPSVSIPVAAVRSRDVRGSPALKEGPGVSTRSTARRFRSCFRQNTKTLTPSPTRLAQKSTRSEFLRFFVHTTHENSVIHRADDQEDAAHPPHTLPIRTLAVAERQTHSSRSYSAHNTFSTLPPITETAPNIQFRDGRHSI